jgi:hypothetical protein
MACSSNDGCTDPLAPICAQGACVACTLDDECTSGVCRPDGSCESAANVLYVSVDGVSAGQCTAEMPCELLYARSIVTPQRRSLRVANGTYSLPGAFVIAPPIAAVTVVGTRGAVFERSTTGPTFDVRDGSSLELRGVTLHRGIECDTGTLNIAHAGFNSPGSEVRSWLVLENCMTSVAASELDMSTALGIDSSNNGTLRVVESSITGSTDTAIRMNGGELTIERCTIAENQGMGVDATTQQLAVRRSMFYSNRLGGISSVNGVFDVTNNFVYRNGNAGNALFGGLRLDTYLAGNRFEHNTVVRNDAEYGATPVYAGGVFCKGGGSTKNNLITNNFYGNEFDPSAQVGGTCTFSGSLIDASDDAVHFARPIEEPFDYHLADAQSTAVNTGVLGTPPITDDFDGDPRDDGMPDMGADELRP